MQLMQLSFLNKRMSFLDVGGVVSGRVDGIVAFMREMYWPGHRTVQSKKDFFFGGGGGRDFS